MSQVPEAPPAVAFTPCRLVGWKTPKSGEWRPHTECPVEEYRETIKGIENACEYMMDKPCRVYLDWDKKADVSDCYEAPKYMEKYEMKSIKDQIKEHFNRTPLFQEQPYTLLCRNPRIEGDMVKFSYRIIFPNLITADHTKIGEYLISCGFENNKPYDLKVYDRQRLINAPYCCKPELPGNPLRPYYGNEQDMPVSKMLITSYDPTLPMIDWEQHIKKPVEVKKAVEVKTYEPTAPVSEDKVKDILHCISADCDYTKWLNILSAVKGCLADSENAYDIADEWSATGKNYDSRAFGRTWSSIKDYDKFGFGVLFNQAKEEQQPAFKEFLQKHRKVYDGLTLTTCFNYAQLKELFEKEVYRIQKPAMFYVMKSNGEFDVMNVKGLKDSYSHINYDEEKKGETVRKSFVDKWLRDGTAKMYEYEEFDPSMKAGAHIYNTFKGFAGEKLMTGGDITLIINHFKLLFRDDYEYVLKWFANILQNPAEKTKVALILHSTKEGAGKTMLVEWFGEKVMGEAYYKKTSDPANDLFGRFSSAIKNRLLITLEEARGQDIKPNMDKLKDMITSYGAKMEQKGVGSVMDIKNYASFVFLTNNDNPITISFSDRRFAGFNCDNEMCQNEEYFTTLADVMKKEEVAGAFYEYLMNIDLTGFSFQERPQTEYYLELQRINIPNWAKFLSWKFNQDCRMNKYGGTELYTSYKHYTEYGGYDAITSTAFGLKIKPYIGEGKPIEKVKSHGVMKYAIDWDALKEQMTKEKLWDDEAI